MRSTVQCGRSKPFAEATLTSYDNASLSYAWDLGSYHFVQLHNHPLYPRDEEDPDHVKTYDVPGISSSFAWLAADLARATAAGKYIVINMHDFGEHMKQSNGQFAAAIAGSNLRAIFAGHVHHHLGNVGSLLLGSRTVPIFRSGASVYQRFLVVELGPHSLRVGQIDSSSGAPRIVAGSSIETVSLTP